MKKIPIIILAIILLAPQVSFADSAVVGGKEFGGATPSASYTLLEPLPCIGGDNCKSGDTIKKIDIQTYILYLFKLMVAVAVFLAIVMITWGGFTYMTSEAIPAKIDAKSTITNALLGLLGALGSYLLVATIDPRLVDISRVTVPKLNLGTKTVIDPAAMTIALGQQAKDAMAQSSALRTQAQGLQSQIDAIDTQLETENRDTLTPAQITDLENQRQSLINQQTTYNNQATVVEQKTIANQTYQNIMIGTGASSNGTTPALITEAQTKMNTSYDAAIQAATISGDSATAKTLTDTKNLQSFSLDNYKTEVTLESFSGSSADFSKAKQSAITSMQTETAQITSSTDPATAATYLDQEKIMYSKLSNLNYSDLQSNQPDYSASPIY